MAAPTAPAPHRGHPGNGRSIWCARHLVFLLLLLDRQRGDSALAQLWWSGLGVNYLFIHALSDYPYLADVVPVADVPHAHDFAARSLTLGNSPWMSEADRKAVCGALERQ